MEHFFKNPALLDAPTRRAAYSDRTAWVMSQCASLAYKEDPEILCKLLAQGDFHLIDAFSGTGNNNAYLAESKKHNMAVLAFKGTVPSEWNTVKTDLKFWHYHSKDGTFHKGFYEAYKSMEKAILRAWN